MLKFFVFNKNVDIGVRVYKYFIGASEVHIESKFADLTHSEEYFIFRESNERKKFIFSLKELGYIDKDTIFHLDIKNSIIISFFDKIFEGRSYKEFEDVINRYILEYAYIPDNTELSDEEYFSKIIKLIKEKKGIDIVI